MDDVYCFVIVVKSLAYWLLCFFAEDERMYHICMWPGHREHFNERTDVFYKRFSKILAFNRLVSFVLNPLCFNYF